MGLWDDDEDVAPARSGFVKLQDLFTVPEDEISPRTPGRLLVIKPLSSGTRQSKIQGQGDYTYVECDIAVLDGPITEMIPEIPFILEGFQMSGQSLTGLLLPKLRNRKSVLGRLGAHKAQGYTTLGWHLDEPSDADWGTYQKFKTAMKERNAKAEREAMSPAQESGGQAAAPWG
jgi:hypothetical protein